MWYALTSGSLGVALIAALLLRFIRRRGSPVPLTRITGAVAFGAALGALSFSVLTRLPAELDWLYAYNYPRLADSADAGYDEALVAHKGAVVDELWTRAMISPAGRAPCYAGDATVCDLADLVMARATEEYGLPRGEEFYALRVFLGVSIGVFGGAVAWYLARPRKPEGLPPNLTAG